MKKLYQILNRFQKKIQNYIKNEKTKSLCFFFFLSYLNIYIYIFIFIWTFLVNYKLIFHHGFNNNNNYDNNNNENEFEIKDYYNILNRDTYFFVCYTWIGIK